MGTLEFLVIVPSALVAAYFGLKLCSGNIEQPRKSRYWTICLVCLATVFGIGGLISVWRITTSERPVVSGTVVGLKQTHNRGAASYFRVQTSYGQQVGLRASYDGPMLQDGEEVSVRYMSDYGAVLDLEVLSGAHLHWKLHESDGLGPAHFATYAGIACGVLTLIVWLGIPREELADG